MPTKEFLSLFVKTDKMTVVQAVEKSRADLLIRFKLKFCISDVEISVF
jgi:hypothetical protein